jgi:hypothetical protein
VFLIDDADGNTWVMKDFQLGLEPRWNFEESSKIADSIPLSADTGTRFGASGRSPVAAVLCRKEPWAFWP